MAVAGQIRASLMGMVTPGADEEITIAHILAVMYGMKGYYPEDEAVVGPTAAYFANQIAKLVQPADSKWNCEQCGQTEIKDGLCSNCAGWDVKIAV